MLQFRRNWLCSRNRVQRWPQRTGRRRAGLGVHRRAGGREGEGGGVLGSESTGFYLEIIELDCEWLEVVVVALSWEKPLWLDSRLVMEPLWRETNTQRTCERTSKYTWRPTSHMHQQSDPQSAWTSWIHSVLVVQNHAARRELDSLCVAQWVQARMSLCIAKLTFAQIKGVLLRNTNKKSLWCHDFLSCLKSRLWQSMKPVALFCLIMLHGGVNGRAGLSGWYAGSVSFDRIFQFRLFGSLSTFFYMNKNGLSKPR